ncbi:glutathione-dependent formaldehyde-activating enzyme [Mariprofundus micogutta]|uniref:Glutathione-dependent formaldehyde-activating enzyme n=1 Tax=Mariprofundus micogutta TaxID=1921010 RepID=A0A1L8CJS2_9PROT|nr:GFA family protein [Mariprofundus micogutta]GAV19168.1 glutathione-dependent formaldehyde-activating enzyme [Mariprofundus micogutta]
MVKGSCLCGQVKYEIHGEMGEITHCHCPTCQKAHATAFSSVAWVQLNDLHFTAGENLLKFYESSPGKKRYFCSNCGSQIYAKREDQNHYIFRMGTIDGDPGIRPARHTFTRYKAPWYNIHDDIPEFSEWPVESSVNAPPHEDRLHLMQTIHSILTLAARQGTATSLLLLNIGDQNMANISDQIKRNVRESDIIEQLDDTYAVLLPYTDTSASLVLAERICNTLKADTLNRGSHLNIGAATLHADQLDNSNLLTNGDDLLHKASRALDVSTEQAEDKAVHFNSLASALDTQPD